MLAVAVLGAPRVALAVEVGCAPAEKGSTTLDGLTDEWAEVEGADGGGDDPGFTFKCALENETLFLLVDVRDHYFVRTTQNGAGEDHFVLELGGRRLGIYPGDAARIKDHVVGGDKRIRTASALQEHGWAVEISLPLLALPRWKHGAARLPFSLTVDDCDSKATRKTEHTAAIDGELVFSAAARLLDGFLAAEKLSPTLISFDQPIATGKKSGGRALVIGQDLVFLVDDSYVFQQLPVADRRDIKEVKLIDLGGDGRQSVVVRYVERSQPDAMNKEVGSREVLAVYRPDSEQVRRLFATEVAKTSGARHLGSKVAFVRRGSATDLVLDATPAVGWSAATFAEQPSDDMVPILLPWSSDKHARYVFHGQEYQRQ